MGKVVMQVVVVGAGIGGLGVAIAVSNAGHRVTVLEQAPEFVEIGAGVQIPPNSTRELGRWGLYDALNAICSRPTRINYRNWQTGEPQGFSDMTSMPKRYGAPYFQIYRPDYHRILLEAARGKGVNVRKGCTVRTYNPEEASVTFESGEIVRGDLLVCADGVKSLARGALGLNVEPHETGDTCFRVVIPGEKLLETPLLAPLSKVPGFEQFLGPDHHIIGYNMQKEKSFNLLMVIPDDHEMIGYKAPSTAQEVRKAFRGWSPIVQALLSFLPDEVERWRLIDLPPMEDWVHPSGRSVLVGDAVHATLPYLAQGAAMAIEDAATLGSVLSHLNTLEDLPLLLKLFYELRVDRVHSIQRGSWTNRFFIHMGPGQMLDMRESVFKAGDYPGSPNLMGNSLFQDYMYGFDATRHAEQAYEARYGTKL